MLHGRLKTTVPGAFNYRRDSRDLSLVYLLNSLVFNCSPTWTLEVALTIHHCLIFSLTTILLDDLFEMFRQADVAGIRN